MDKLIKVLRESEKAALLANDLKKRHWGGIITGVITDVQDPLRKGRVRLSLDSFNQEFSSSYWWSVVGAAEGYQPKSLVGSKVLIGAVEGSPYQYKILGLLDGDYGTYSSETPIGEYSAKNSKTPGNLLQNTAPMVNRSGIISRLAVYNSREGDVIPQCNGKNQGLEVVYDDGTNSRLLTCLRYRGGFKWCECQRKVFEN